MSNKRHVMYKKLEKLQVTPPNNLRTITEMDAVALGHLMYASYKGTIDYEGETLEQSIQEMSETLSGKYGELNCSASLMILEGDKAIAVVIFVFYNKEEMPLLAFTMTHPDHQGKGLSQSLIKTCLSILHDQGSEQCCLVVTEGNQPAQGIYQKMGFSLSKV